MVDHWALPHPGKIESRNVLRRVAEAHRYLAELKGLANTMPNQEILIDTLGLQEARESSAIENIISTFSDIYQSDVENNSFMSPAAKGVHDYANALRHGFELVKHHDLITINHILEIQSIVESNKAGFRKLPGTVLRNTRTQEVIYTPPQDYDTIVRLMDNLQRLINDPGYYDADPLVKMAIIHHQFESIHPFYDGNGRMGRILNILYLIQQGLLEIPILYLSRYIIAHKAKYYNLLQSVRETNEWEAWIIFMTDAVTATAKDTIRMVKGIEEAMTTYKNILLEKAPKLYSYELLLHLFHHPYSKIEYVMKDLGISRNTVIRYLGTLEELNLIEKIKKGRDNYYLNKALVGLLIEPGNYQ
jgi:Fic family protein